MRKILFFVISVIVFVSQTIHAQRYYATMHILAPAEQVQIKKNVSPTYFIEINGIYAGTLQAHEFVEIKLLPGSYTIMVYANITPKGTILPKSLESAKINGIAMQYDSVSVQAGNSYYIDVTQKEHRLADLQTYLMALSKKMIVPGGSIDFPKISLSTDKNTAGKNPGSPTNPSKKTSSRNSKYAPISNSVKKKLPLKADMKFFSFLAFSKNICAPYIKSDIEMNYIDSMTPPIGTIDFHCVSKNVYGNYTNTSYMTFWFYILDKNENVIRKYAYQKEENFQDGIHAKDQLRIAREIMNNFRQDYTRDIALIDSALQVPKPIKTVEVTISAPSIGERNPKLFYFLEIDGEYKGAIPVKGAITCKMQTGCRNIGIYPNIYWFASDLNNGRYATTLQQKKQVNKGWWNDNNAYAVMYITGESNFLTYNYSDKTITYSTQEENNNYYAMNMLGVGERTNDEESKKEISVISDENPRDGALQLENPQLTKISEVDKNIVQSATKSSNTYVLIFANENYEFLGDVHYASNDGRIFKEYCKKTLGVPERQIFYYANATAGKMEDGISKLTYCLNNFSGAKAIVYYCGHGIPDEKTNAAYLIPTDGKGTNSRTCYSLNELFKTLAATKAQSITYFMDACFTGADKEGGMLVAARGVARAPEKEVLSGKTIVFSASSGDETAMTLEEQRHGLFTYYLLKKLQETDGNVTYGELADYINQNVKKDAFLINEKPQTPVVATSPAVVNTWKTMKLK